MSDELRLTGPAIATVGKAITLTLSQELHEPTGGRGHLEYQVPGAIGWNRVEPGAAVTLDPPEFPFTSQQHDQELAPVIFAAGGKWLVRAVVQPDNPQLVIDGAPPAPALPELVSNALLVRSVVEAPVDP